MLPNQPLKRPGSSLTLGARPLDGTVVRETARCDGDDEAAR